MKIPPECISATRICRACGINYCRRCEFPVKFQTIICSGCYFLRTNPLARLKNNVLLNRLRRTGLKGFSLRELTYFYENNSIGSFPLSLRKRYKKDAFEAELEILHDLFHWAYE